MQIIDAHQHFWDLDRNYLPEHYRTDAAGFDVVGTVFVETEWDPRDPAGEVAWVAGLRAAEHLPSVMVAQAWLDRDDIDDVLARHETVPFVRGVRHKPRAAAGPDGVEPGAPGSMGDPRWRRGFALLSRHGLGFDLQTPWWHLPEARRLADDFPDTRIVLNHTGLPAQRDPEGLAGWRTAMRQLAGAPNVAVKISGLGQAGMPWSLEANRDIVLETIDTLGPDRTMFASNFPVDSLVGSFATIFSGFLAITEAYSAAERQSMFAGTARRIYRIDPASSGEPQ